MLPVCWWCWPATITPCRPITISTRPDPTPTTRCCNRRPACALSACSNRAGATPCSTAAIPDAPIYTYRSHLRNRWSRDAGPCIDHSALLSGPGGEAAVRRRRPRGARQGQRQRPTRLRWWSCGRRSARFGSRLSPREKASRRGPPPAQAVSAPTAFGDRLRSRSAHRAYHRRCRKTFKRSWSAVAGAILGFANQLLVVSTARRSRARGAGRLGRRWKR